MLLCRSRGEKSALFLHCSSTGFWSTGQLSNGLHIRMKRLAAHLWFTPTQSETFPFISNRSLFSPNQTVFKRSKQLYNSWHCSKTEHQLAVKVKATCQCFLSHRWTVGRWGGKHTGRCDVKLISLMRHDVPVITTLFVCKCHPNDATSSQGGPNCTALYCWVHFNICLDTK